LELQRLLLRRLRLELIEPRTHQVGIKSVRILLEEHLERRLGADILEYAHHQFVVDPHLVLIDDLRPFRRGDQRDIAAAERTVDERLLPIVGNLQNLVAHAPEGEADVEAGLAQIVQDRGGEWAVFASAVLGGLALLRSVGDEGLGAGVQYRSEAGRNLPRRLALPLHGRQKRIVPARIEYHEAQALRTVDRLNDAGEFDRLVRGVAVAGELGVDRNHVIGATDLDAVPGIKHHGDVGVVRGVFEPAYPPFELQIADVLQQGDLIARRGEHLGDGLCVLGRIGQPASVLVGRVSHHQRHALVGQGRDAGYGEHQPTSDKHRGDETKALHDQHPATRRQ